MSDSFWRGRNVFVTGCSGLLGSWLAQRLLERDARVVGLIRDRVPHSLVYTSGTADRISTVSGDVRDQALLERVLAEYEIQTVFHLAAQTIVGTANRSPVGTFEVNIGGTWALLEAVRRSSGVEQVVVASSDKAYGEQARLPYTEDAPLHGRHPYDVSKSCADLIAQAYASTYGMAVGVTRCGNLYGGGDLNWNRIVPGTMRSIAENTPPVIRSDGSLTRDYLFIEDGVSAYLTLAEALAAGEAGPGATFNFGNDAPITVLELVRQILTATGSELEPDVRGQASHEIPQQFLDSSAARKQLGWAPQFSLQQGLEQTWQWYRQYFGTMNRD